MRYILRRLLRAPVFTAVTLLTLALGIGANSAIFSVIDGVLVKPLPYPEPGRLLAIWQIAPGLGMNKSVEVSPAEYFVFREQNHTFEQVGVWQRGSCTVTGNGEPEQVDCVEATHEVLEALGVPPLLGRRFTAYDDKTGSPDVALATHAFWQRRFGGDAGAVGRPILVNGRSWELAGVMPAGFRFLDRKIDLILPLRLERSKTLLGNFSYQSIARLKPGVTPAQANADIARMIPMMYREFPAPPGFSVQLFQQARLGPAARTLHEDVVGDVGKVLWVVMGTIGMVLLIACANVANLLLVRVEGRQQELAIRAALGAGWVRIAREMLLESVLLAIAGGLLGLAVARAGLRMLVAIGPARLPRLDNISVDARVLGFTFAVSVAAGLLFGAIPVLKYAGPQIVEGLRGGGRTMSQSRERHRARNTMVVVQMALALVLLVAAGLMVRTFAALREVRPGFTRGGEVQTLTLFIPQARVRDAEGVMRKLQDIQRRIEEIPGVASAAFASSVPTDGFNSADPLYTEDRSYRDGELAPVRRFKFTGPGYFRTIGDPVLAGREITWTDIYDRRKVAVITGNLARELWREPAAAIGKRIRENKAEPWREVVGVVGDIRDEGAAQKAPAIVYWPMLMKDFWGNETFVQRRAVFTVRSSRAGTQEFAEALRKAVWAADPDLPLANVHTLEEVYNKSMARTSFTLAMLGIAGGMALLLGMVGIYGAISYAVSQRTREIGIRMALGAQHGELRRMFVGYGLSLAAGGVGCGLALAFGLTRLMTSLLYEVKPMDPPTCVGVGGGLVAAAIAASYLPARRASAVDPVEALRSE